MDEALNQKLKSYLDSGKSYQEASALLVAQGYTAIQVLDAKATLNRSAGAAATQKLDISGHPELASTLLEVTDATRPKNHKMEQETDVMLPTSLHGVSYYKRIKGNIYWLFIGAIIIFIIVFVIAGQLIH